MPARAPPPATQIAEPTEPDASPSSATMETSPTAPLIPDSGQKASGKRLQSDTATAMTQELPHGPHAKRSCLAPASKPFALTSAPYKAVIKARTCVDLSAIPIKSIQSCLDACLQTSGFKGYSLHRPTNTVSVWLPSLDAVDRLRQLTQLVIPAGEPIPVQAYLASGADLRRYVIAGVDANESQDALCKEIWCPTHTVVAARHMGKGGTCLVTVRGPPTQPEKFYYYGCILRPRPFKPSAVYCYRCYKQGHMKSSCPYPQQDAAMNSPPIPPHRCELCKTDDHDITSPQCPTKLNATQALRRRHRPLDGQVPGNRAPVELDNRFEVLAQLETERSAVPPLELLPVQSSYSAALRTPRQRLPRNSPAAPPAPTEPEDLVSLDTRLARLQEEIDHLRRRRELLARRTAATPTLPPDATVHTPASRSASGSCLTPLELLQFVAQQLMSLSHVLATNLPN